MLFNRWIVVVVVSSAVIGWVCSCSSNASHKTLFERLDNTLTQANRVTKQSNDAIIATLYSREQEPATKERAGVWLLKAKHIDSITTTLLEYIDSLKSSINTSDLWSQETGKLYQQLTFFKKAVVPIHWKIKELPVLVQDFHYTEWRTKSKDYFSHTSAARAFLTSIQNEVLQATNGCLLIFLDQTAILCDLGFTSFEAIVGQNAKVLHVGDQLEITAGLGAFSQNKIPQIIIDKRPVSVNDHGFAVYKIQTAQKPGSYAIPVSISFIDQDNKQQTRTFQIEYRLVNY